MVIPNKLFFEFLLSFMHLNASADSIKFRLYMRDQCDGSITLTSFYYFTKSGDSSVFKPESGTYVCKLPSLGIYKLHFLLNEYPLTYNFKGQQSDTLNGPKVIFGYPNVDNPEFSPGYVVCNSKNAEGRIVDYFKNKKKRLTGTFHNGKLSGKLIYYDLNGEIVKIQRDNKKNKRRNRN